MKAINSLEDSQLICMYKKGNEAAFAELLHRYKERIFRFILSKIRNKKLSEDIFQEAFIKIIKTIKSGSYITSFWEQMAGSLVVGLTVATILTLVVTPCALAFSDSIRSLPSRLLKLILKPFSIFGFVRKAS